MRKLLMLASFEAKTGDLQFKEYRQLLIHERPGDDHFTISKRAYSDIFWPWFTSTYPESECISFILFETIASSDDVEKEASIHAINWCEPSINERAKHGFLFWTGGGGPLGQGFSGVVGEGETREAAAMDFIDKLKANPAYSVIRYENVKS